MQLEVRGGGGVGGGAGGGGGGLGKQELPLMGNHSYCRVGLI